MRLNGIFRCAYSVAADVVPSFRKWIFGFDEVSAKPAKSELAGRPSCQTDEVANWCPLSWALSAVEEEMRPNKMSIISGECLLAAGGDRPGQRRAAGGDSPGQRFIVAKENCVVPLVVVD